MNLRLYKAISIAAIGSCLAWQTLAVGPVAAASFNVHASSGGKSSGGGGNSGKNNGGGWGNSNRQNGSTANGRQRDNGQYQYQNNGNYYNSGQAGAQQYQGQNRNSQPQQGAGQQQSAPQTYQQQTATIHAPQPIAIQSPRPITTQAVQPVATHSPQPIATIQAPNGGGSQNGNGFLKSTQIVRANGGGAAAGISLQQSGANAHQLTMQKAVLAAQQKALLYHVQSQTAPQTVRTAGLTVASPNKAAVIAAVNRQALHAKLAKLAKLSVSPDYAVGANPAGTAISPTPDALAQMRAAAWKSMRPAQLAAYRAATIKNFAATLAARKPANLASSSSAGAKGTVHTLSRQSGFALTGSVNGAKTQSGTLLSTANPAIYNQGKPQLTKDRSGPLTLPEKGTIQTDNTITSTTIAGSGGGTTTFPSGTSGGGGAGSGQVSQSAQSGGGSYPSKNKPSKPLKGLMGILQQLAGGGAQPLDSQAAADSGVPDCCNGGGACYVPDDSSDGGGCYLSVAQGPEEYLPVGAGASPIPTTVAGQAESAGGGVVAASASEEASAPQMVAATAVPHRTRFLRVANAGKEKATLHLAYYTEDSNHQWKWFPAPPGEKTAAGDALSFELAPNEGADLADDGWRINASKVRIWGTSADGREWTKFKDKDLLLVPETDANGDNLYAASEKQTFSFTVK